jgi:hypothetical protein
MSCRLMSGPWRRFPTAPWRSHIRLACAEALPHPSASRHSRSRQSGIGYRARIRKFRQVFLATLKITRKVSPSPPALESVKNRVELTLIRLVSEPAGENARSAGSTWVARALLRTLRAGSIRFSFLSQLPSPMLGRAKAMLATVLYQTSSHRCHHNLPSSSPLISAPESHQSV